jgi:hypothetical protein
MTCNIVNFFEFKKMVIKKYKTHTLLCASILSKDSKNENYKETVKTNNIRNICLIK